MRLKITGMALLLAAFFGLRPAAADSPHNIAVFGDSLADGVWSALHVDVKARPDDKLYRDSKVGTGITRPDYDAFFQSFAATLGPDHITDAVIIFGANDDGNSLRDEQHKGYLFGSPGWTKVYESRVETIIATCHSDGIKVYWLGLPVLRDAQMNQGALFLNGILQQTVQGNKAVFIPLEDDFKDPSGNFATHLPDAAGDLRVVRAEDGVHFSFYGYGLIANKVLAVLESPQAPAQK
jgi:hypothetical protein